MTTSSTVHRSRAAGAVPSPAPARPSEVERAPEGTALPGVPGPVDGAVADAPPPAVSGRPGGPQRGGSVARPGRNRGEWRPAAELPVARVAVDVALAHLDRPFDYRVPEHLAAVAVPGVRLRVRFAGRLVDGYLLERLAESPHTGKLAWVEKVVSPEPVLTPEVAALCRAVADRYAGVLADVLRLAVPPRHAKAEAAAVDVAAPAEGSTEPAPAPAAAPGAGPVEPAAWRRYQHGAALLDALARGRTAHAVWQALPGECWPERLAEAAAATVAAGRGAVLVVPDQRDVAALHAACAARLGADGVVALTAELGPAERYRRWLAVRRGHVRVVVGTRSAAFAPVDRLGLLAVWDDGDDLHSEPRAPYPHVRDVLVLRAHSAGAALLVGGFARTAEAHVLVGSGWAREVVAERATVRAAMPRITALGETDAQLVRDPDSRAARLPHLAFEAARAALGAGRPVLVQVPRAGYLPWLACGTCRETARCRHCAGPLGLTGRRGRDGAHDDAAGLPHCRWCGRPDSAFRCPACGSRRLRAGVVGSGRTAEELGRAFPGTAVRTSGGGAPVLAEVAAQPELVVATPGAEPRAAGGYGAALLLDGWAMLSRPDLRVAEETLRRWFAAAALVVPHTEGGRVVVMADTAIPVVQALVRWDPAGHAAAELASRAEVGFPPAVRMATVEGTAGAVADMLAELPAVVEVLGPVELDPVGIAAGDEPPEVRERALLRVPRADGRAMAAALHAAQAARTARKVPDPVRVRLDPVEIG
ncbi:primosomal protein N' [Pseudonocardia xinjiangensis]|uniref:Probable replication restart protein PriA n=1 Tax=Pseudonocardia xinjiangensis TaxID=75289 RepID=A0ABX1RI32_9PSEU|nr:primosomal protein N' [Pseudonocardia xinjiangensis]NMH79476.1 primosomal protein N' [Pseudonocardia xinjiangensis]